MPKPSPRQDADLDGLAQRVLQASDEDLDALARAVACLDLRTARAFIDELRQRAEATRATPRAWPPLGELGLLDDPTVDAAARGPDPVIVNIEARLLAVPGAWLADHLGDVGADGAGVHLLDDEKRDALLAQVGQADGVTQVTAPRLSAYSGQRAMISLLNQVSYVQDYDVQVGSDGSSIADPIVAVVNDGIVIEMKGTVSDDRKFVTLEIASTSSELERPLQEIAVTLGATTATVQVPVVQTHQMRGAVHLPTGGTVLLVDGTPHDAGTAPGQRVLLVTAHVVN